MTRIKKQELEHLKTVVSLAEKGAKNPKKNLHIVIIKDFIKKNDENYNWKNPFTSNNKTIL